MNSVLDGHPAQVRVVHIGDSHIEGGRLTQRLRYALQRCIGNAGVRFVAPYAMAGHEGLPDIKLAGFAPWTLRRAPNMRDTAATGAAGVSAVRWDPDVLVITGAALRRQAFDVGDVSVLGQNLQRGPVPFRCSGPRLDESTCWTLGGDSLLISVGAANPLAPMRVDGVVLSDTAAGVTLDEVAANSMTIRQFLSDSVSLEQIVDIDPQLVIVSIGTNDLLNRSLSEHTLEAELTALIVRVQRIAPRSSILLTTPPRVYKQSAAVRARVDLMTRVIERVADLHIAASIDVRPWFDARGSGRNLIRRQILRPDGVHLMQAAYESLGEAMAAALLRTLR